MVVFLGGAGGGEEGFEALVGGKNGEEVDDAEEGEDGGKNEEAEERGERGERGVEGQVEVESVLRLETEGSTSVVAPRSMPALQRGTAPGHLASQQQSPRPLGGKRCTITISPTSTRVKYSQNCPADILFSFSIKQNQISTENILSHLRQNFRHYLMRNVNVTTGPVQAFLFN